jgi:phosphopantetheinyl transferase (holo-ACP synthase)
MGISELLVSISHGEHYAVANALAVAAGESGKPPD